MSLRIGICGLGTVGAAVLGLLKDRSGLLQQRSGTEMEVVAVSARNRNLERPVSLHGIPWFDDPIDMAAHPDIDVIVELIGGSDGIALDICKTALASHKHIVTANKALIAHHGLDLAEKAEAVGSTIGFEAAVAGGIPVIKVLREGLAANGVDSIYGILNGTSNYILSEMRDNGSDFGTVLKEAQDKGYAEADPQFDIDGTDAAHKLTILAALAFGCRPSFDDVTIAGISDISELDISFSDELGYRIKLLAIARRGLDGYQQSVEPCMVPKVSPIANVEGVFNAVSLHGDRSGPIFLEGRGAGAAPTASAVVADLVDLARGISLPIFGVPTKSLAPNTASVVGTITGRYYVRLMVLDRPGVFAEIAAALRDEDVSMEAILQRTRAPGDLVPVVMTTHEVEQRKIGRVLEKFSSLETVIEEPRVIKIEPLGG
ncbi:MAG: homoserine dehydrogenase [Rhodospirillaceae bacterium]